MICPVCNKQSAPKAIEESEEARVIGVNAAWSYLNRGNGKPPEKIDAGKMAIIVSFFWLVIILLLSLIKVF